MFARLARLASPCALLGIGVTLLGCSSNAEAMTKKKPGESVPVPVEVNPVEVVDGSVDYQRGYELGHRNGNLIAERLRVSTIGRDGCGALSTYQAGLLEVARRVRPPQTVPGTVTVKDLGKGFFRGYLDAVRAAIRDSREGCGVVSFDDGTFAGELYGNLLCQTATANLEVFLELEPVPLYEGWSGGALEVRDQCLVQATVTLSKCETNLEEVKSSTELLLNLSCSD